MNVLDKSNYMKVVYDDIGKEEIEKYKIEQLELF